MDFSIIIPAKNEQEYLPHCLDSLSRLNYPREKFEILVIDNGSTDTTVEIARQYNANVFICPDLSIGGLRNFGAHHAQGQVLAFLDADCTVTADWLQAAARWKDELEVCCFGSPPEVPENATWVQRAWALVRYKRETVENVQWLESMNMFVRKEIFDKIHGFDEFLTTCEDYDLSLRLQDHGHIVADRRIRAIHFGEASTLAHFFRKEQWRGVSNFSGLRQHGIHVREIPSLLIPPLQVAFLVAMTFSLQVLAISGGERGLTIFIALLLIWQLPLLFLAFWKSRTASHLNVRLGLYVLLNLYFLARGTSMIQGRWRR